MRYAYLLLFAVLTGCATAPVQHTFNRQTTLPGATFDEVWNQVIDLYGERTWTIANMEKASGFINSDWMASDNTPEYMDCGSSALGTDTHRQGKFNVIVRQESTGVSLTINTSWRTNRTGMGATTTIDCTSTGVLEQEIQTEIRKRVGVGD